MKHPFDVARGVLVGCTSTTSVHVSSETLSRLGTAQLVRIICYSTFGRAYNEYKRDPPASMKDVSMASQSGCLDQLFGRSTYYTSDGKRHKAEIFVALMPYSNLPFGLATHN